MRRGGLVATVYTVRRCCGSVGLDYTTGFAVVADGG